MKRVHLINARKNHGWTQAQVAEKLGITPSFYGMIEQGSRNPRLPLALAMEKLFGIPASELFPDLFNTQKPNKMFGKLEQQPKAG
ncbi:transcriptional regulator [Carboxydothermus islandicus]|uniref:Transcriptional regulator n=1 Tax=Carboxydothermus islandicus TaxID=661089 RepID=A0A1L8D0T2_9THEO|nr:helix-turn-helix transcriptional regulator [Carboxydothermus islandicus]GAV24768.1 transcriptional regulator [Carboxydothermus islandicus]